MWTGCVFSREHAFLTVVEWPHVIIPATGSPTSCCCKEGQAERLCDICVLTGRLCRCTNRQTNNTLKDRRTTPCLVPSGRHTPVTTEDWQIYDIVLETSSIQTVVREQHQSIVLKTGRSIHVSSWPTDGPIARHHASQWLGPVWPHWRTASNTMLSDRNQAD